MRVFIDLVQNPGRYRKLYVALAGAAVAAANVYLGPDSVHVHDA